MIGWRLFRADRPSPAARFIDRRPGTHIVAIVPPPSANPCGWCGDDTGSDAAGWCSDSCGRDWNHRNNTPAVTL